MSALLIEKFDLVLASEGGIARLRELILGLAVRGKLVPQVIEDQNAGHLLNEVRAERDRLIKEGKIRRVKPIAHIDSDEVPFELPPLWVWARLDWLSPYSLVDGDWIESKDQDPSGGIRLIQLADVGDGEFRDKSTRFVNDATRKKLNCTLLQTGDILIARLPSPVGRACVFPGLALPAITAVDVAICRLGRWMNRDYLVHAINSKLVRQQIEDYGKGATRFRVATGHLKTVLIPVPPQEEQLRIVAKVRELLTLCARLEAERALISSVHAQLAEALVESALAD